jgi:hypothetical protein
MPTPITKREPPEGYTEARDKSLWYVGHVFMWSDVYENWLSCGMCTVRPEQSIAEAYEAWADEPMWPDYNVFFPEEIQ